MSLMIKIFLTEIVLELKHNPKHNLKIKGTASSALASLCNVHFQWFHSNYIALKNIFLKMFLISKA